MTPPTPSPAGRAIGFFLRAVGLHWRLLPLPLALGVAASVAAALALGKHAWESAGVMIYTPVPVPDSQKNLYPQPDVQTLVSLVKSPGVLNAIRDELDLPVPTRLLEKVVTVAAPRNVQTVTVSVKWAEPGMAAKIVNSILRQYIEQVRAQRQRRAGEALADYEARLADCDARHARAGEAYRQFFRTHNLFDARSELDSTRLEIIQLSTTRSNGTRTEAAILAQRERMTQELETTRRKAAEDEEKKKKFDASQESVADARRRQDRLRELIDEEKKRQGWQVELASKRKEYQRAAEARDRGAESPQKVDEISREIDLLTARLSDTDDVKKWKKELESIDQVVVPKGAGNASGSPIIQQILFRQLELDLQLVANHKEMFAADKALAEARRRQTELQVLLAQSDGLQKTIDALVAERAQLADQVGLFRRLHDQKAGEFAVVSAATPAPYPASSTRKLWMIGGVGLTGLLALGRVCRREWIDGYHAGRSAAARSNIPLAAVLCETAESERRAATELRRWVPGYGATLMLCEAGGAGVMDATAARLAARYSSRDERVLVVDCRFGCEPGPGLSDLLTFRAASKDLVTRAGASPGVDVIPPGESADPDVLATHLTRELFATARKQYSLVLILAPCLGDSETLDVLAPHADGVLVCLGRSPLSPADRGALAPLAERCGGKLRALLDDRGDVLRA